jgi:hypothetical protein
MTSSLKAVSVRLPVSDLRRIPEANLSTFIRDAVHEKLARLQAPEWRPATRAGKRMAELRKRNLARGEELLDEAGIAAELRQRRGGLA